MLIHIFFPPGMVSMCAGCNDLYPWSAVVIGAIAGISFMTWRYLVLKMKIDDPLDAVAGKLFLFL